MSERPTFDGALEGFRRFAKTQNAPDEMSFIGPDDIVVTGTHATIRRPPAAIRLEEARSAFEAGMNAGLGAVIGGVAATKTELFCFVYRPTDREDAVSRLIPPDVKYSLRTPLFVAHLAGPILWWILRRRERGDRAARQWKEDTFGYAA